MRTGAAPRAASTTVLVLATLLLHSASIRRPFHVAADDGHKVATIAAKILPRGLEYYAEQLQKLMTSTFLGLRLPDIDSPPEHEYLNTRNAYIHEFVAPKMVIRPTDQGHIQMEGTNGMVGITGAYEATYTFPFYRQVNSTFTFHTTNVTVQMELAPMLGDHDAPQLRPFSCLTTIGKNEVRLSGNEETPLPDAIIGNFYCRQLIDLVRKINYRMEKLHSGYPMAEDITVQYNMIDDVISEDGGLTGFGYVDVVYANKTCRMPPVPVDVKKGPAMAREFMMTVWLSTSVFNCLLDALHHNYHNKWMPLIGRESPKLGAYMATSCAAGESCVGDVVPGLEAFPHQFVTFHIFSAHPPRVQLKEASRDVLFDATLNVQMRLANTDHALVTMNVLINAKLEPFIANSRLCAKIAETPSLNLTVTRSELGEKAMDSSVWQALIDVMRSDMTTEVNARLVDGFPLPKLSPMPVSDDYVRIALQDDQMRIAFDMVSTPLTFEVLNEPI